MMIIISVVNIFIDFCISGVQKLMFITFNDGMMCIKSILCNRGETHKWPHKMMSSQS